LQQFNVVSIKEYKDVFQIFGESVNVDYRIYVLSETLGNGSTAYTILPLFKTDCIFSNLTDERKAMFNAYLSKSKREVLNVVNESILDSAKRSGGFLFNGKQLDKVGKKDKVWTLTFLKFS
jgi:hypothetical protein